MSELIIPKAVFFDWDGTLVDSFSFLQDIHNYVLHALNLPVREDGWFAYYFGKERDWIYRDIYGDMEAQARILFADYLEENHVKVLKQMNGAHDVLSVLKDHGIACGVVTNKKGDWVRKEIKAFGWEDYFASIVGAGEATADKPSSAPLEKALHDAQLNVKPDQIWFIGDTDSDLKCAENYGSLAILIHPNPKSESWFDDFNPFMTFKDCQDLHVFLLQNLGKSLQKMAK